MLAKLLAEMGKSGSNLNQIAYQLNSGETVELPELAEAIAGLTLIALLTRAGELDDAWVDRTTTLLLKGIGE